MQQRITLQPTQLYFPSLDLLWAFAQTITRPNLEINTREVSLLCVCSEEDISRALSDYKATLHHNQRLQVNE
jgi:hypothetical protein